MTKSDYDDIIQLLPLMIIVYSKNYTISIIMKENITVNRQNRLIAHPYMQCDKNNKNSTLQWLVSSRLLGTWYEVGEG